MSKLSTINIEYLKREAKQLCRNSSLTHSAALDQIATENGYLNWSLLMKHHASSLTEESQGAAPVGPFVFVRSPEEMRLALRVIPYRRYGPHQDELARREVADICPHFVSAANAVDYSIDYLTCLLEVPRYYVNSGAKVYHEMRRWLPYHIEPINDDLSILVNRHYKPVGMTTGNWVAYEEYQHLHLSLDDSQRLLITGSSRSSSRGYLFDNGNPPWNGRRCAKAYLNRLHILRSFLRESV